APEFVYTDGLALEEVTVKFELDNSAINNTLGTYAANNDGFKGIKRLNVFMFFEDVNMLLPIETNYDEVNNIVYTTTDRVGTYCLMDMEIFFQNLGIEPSESDDVEVSEAMSGNEEYFRFSVSESNARSNEAKYKDNFDVAFIVDEVSYSDVQLEGITEEISSISEKIFENSENVTISIYGLNGQGGTQSTWYGRTNNIDGLKSMLDRIEHKEINNLYNAVIISDCVDYVIKAHEASETLSARQEYGFIFFDPEYKIVKEEKTTLFTKDKEYPVFFYRNSENESADCGMSLLENLGNLQTSIDFCTITDSFTAIENQDTSYSYALSKKSGGVNIDTVSYESVVNDCLTHIYGEVPENVNAYKAIIATGYNTIVLDKPITPKYAENANKKIINSDYEFDIDELEDCADTDKDGAWDFEEILFEINGVSVIEFDENSQIILPKVKELFHDSNKFPIPAYVESGRDKALEQYGDYYIEFMQCEVLPIRSNPLLKDSDMDGITDNLDLFPFVSDDDLPVVFKDFIISKKIKYSDVLLISNFIAGDEVYLCNVNLAKIFGEDCFVDVPVLNNNADLSEAEEYLDDYYLLAYGSGNDANYFALKWYDYSFIKKMKALNNTGKIRKYSKVNYEELRSEYITYDFWSKIFDSNQRWLKNVNETDEKNIEKIRTSMHAYASLSKYTIASVVIEMVAPGLSEEISHNYEVIVTGFEIKAYETISSITKLPSSVLMLPKTAIEDNYLYRKNFKDKYGFDPGYYSNGWRNSFKNSIKADSTLMLLDDFDTKVISGSSDERLEYYGGALWNLCLGLYMMELEEELTLKAESYFSGSISYKDENGKIITIEGIKQKPIGSRTKIEQEIIDITDAYEAAEGAYKPASGSTAVVPKSFSLIAEAAQEYSSIAVSGAMDIRYSQMLSDCRLYASELVLLTVGNELAMNSLLANNYDAFVGGVNSYGIDYAKLAISYRDEFVNIINEKPQYSDDIIYYTRAYGQSFINALGENLQYTDKIIKILKENTAYEKDIIRLCQHGGIEFIEKMEKISPDDFALLQLDDFKNNLTKKQKDRYRKACVALDIKNPEKYGCGVPGYHSVNDYIFGKSEKNKEVNVKNIIDKLYKEEYHKDPDFNDRNFDYSQYYKLTMTDKYLNELYKLKEEKGYDYFENIGRSYDEVKADMAKLRDDIQKTKDTTGVKENKYGEKSFYYDRSVENCAEVWSVRQAIMEGADYDDIALKCINTYNDMVAKPCENCEHTFAEKLNLWEEE
ncbi:MAG: hypothetical protein NC177_17630, partial [Ruminococcus flavefaciens]|nr:hypothetical protein [Ruminococcus flavefaciens]